MYSEKQCTVQCKGNNSAMYRGEQYNLLHICIASLLTHWPQFHHLKRNRDGLGMGGKGGGGLNSTSKGAGQTVNGADNVVQLGMV